MTATLLKVSFKPADYAAAGVLLGFAKSQENAGPEWLGQAAEHADLLSRAAQAKRFKGAASSAVEVVPASGAISRMIVLGSGEDLTHASAQALGASGMQRAEAGAETCLCIDAAGLTEDANTTAALALGAVLRAYRFDKYRSELKAEDKPSLTEIQVLASDPEAAAEAYADMEAVAEGVYHTRDLISEPANVLYPKSFAKDAARLADLGVEITVMKKDELEDQGFGALLGVSQGSENDPRVVIMHWKGADNDPVALVGKGVTFDTGGISIKPAPGMEDMKWDMGGAGVVVGTMHALAKRKAKANVVGIIGLVENMPDGKAQRPGDIVTSLSGKTIEVLNTDAEGRLVLADILWHVQETYKPKAIVDLATLTGAMLVALGMEQAGLFSNDDQLAGQLEEASKSSGDALWRMPIGQAYNKQLDSPIADMKNIGGGRWGGSITAACFLERFIQDGTPWAHLDIAGVVWSDKDRAVSRKGATGWGVRLLDQWVRDVQG